MTSNHSVIKGTHVVKQWKFTIISTAIALASLVLMVTNAAFCSSTASAQTNTPGKSLEEAKLVVQIGHMWPAACLAISPDGKTVATGSFDSTARLWDAGTGELKRTLVGDNGRIQCIAFSPDGKTIATAGWDSNVTILWNTRTGALRKTLTVIDSVQCLAFSPDGKTIVTLSPDGSVMPWDVKTGELRKTLKGHIIGAYSLVYSHDGMMIAVGNAGGSVKLWDMRTGLLNKITTRQTSSVAFSPNGKTILTYSDGIANLWDSKTGMLKNTTTRLSFLAYNPNGKTIAYQKRDGSICLFDIATGKISTRLLHTENNLDHFLAFSPDGTMIGLQNPKGIISLFDATTGNLSTRLMGTRKNSDRFLDFSPDGKTLATSGKYGAKLWDTNTGALRTTISARGDLFAFSPDGKTTATGEWSASLSDAHTGILKKALKGNNHLYTCFAFSPDGKMIATGYFDANAKIWNTTTGDLISTLTGNAEDSYCLAFSPDGKSIVVGCKDGTIDMHPLSSHQKPCSLYLFDNNGWVVVDRDGRFDGNPAGLAQLHWVAGDTVIELSQLKNRYYEPGLWRKLMGTDPAPLRDVPKFNAVALPPDVDAEPVSSDGKLNLSLTNIGGGIGKIQIFVNDKELTADARGPVPDPDAQQASLTVDVSHAANLVPGQANTVRVVTYNKDGYISSRGKTWEFTPEGDTPAAPPQLYAIVAGIGDYASPALRLSYSVHDAKSVATALELAGNDMLGAGKVHIQLLTSDPRISGDDATQVGPATKGRLAQAFQDVARLSKPQDLLIVFLAGHGVALPAHNSLYCYLTQNATTGTPDALADDVLRESTTVTTEDLTDWIKLIPANKQVMVLDTCAAGAAKVQLAMRSDTSDRIRAVDRLKDRTGFWVLMGCAQSQASYESEEFGEGLLTYSLLEYLRQGSLPGGQVDVSSLFQYARDTVPRMLSDSSFGFDQTPQILSPQAESFPIGRLTRDEQARVPFHASRPMVVRPALDAETLDLGLEALLADRLHDQSSDAGDADMPVLAEASDVRGALQPRGAYTVTGDAVHVTLRLRRDGQLVRLVEVAGSRGHLDTIVSKLVTQINAAARMKAAAKAER